MTGLSSQIYSDLKGGMVNAYEIFTTQLLPAIGDGVNITKDYVMELFGRYIQYAIAMDILGIVLCIIGLIFARVTFNWASRYNKTVSYDAKGAPFAGRGFTFGIISIICIVNLCSLVQHMVQSIYIPELTVYQKIVDMKHDYECSKTPHTVGCN